MPESPPPPVARRPRRWGRWILGILLGGGLLLAGLGTAGWFARVGLINHFANSSNSVWKIRVEAVDWTGGKIEMRNLTVRHADQAEPVFQAPRLTTDATWDQLKQGQLGSVTAEEPVVFWRDGLRQDPQDPEATKLYGPLVSWNSLTLSKGRVDLAEAGSWDFTGTVEGSAGPGAYYHEGWLDLAGAGLTVEQASYSMNLAGPLSRVEASARRVELLGSLKAADGLLVLTKSVLMGTRTKLSTIPTSSPALPAAEDLVSEPQARGMITGVRLHNLTAPGLQAEALLPWALTGRGDLSLAQLSGGSGTPFEMYGARFDGAQLQLPAGAKVDSLEAAVSIKEESPQLDRLTFSGAAVPQLKPLLAAMGLPLTEDFAASFTASGTLQDLILTDGLPASALPQSLVLEEVKANLPGQGKGSLKRVVVEAVPDEVRTSRRLRLVELDTPEAEFTFSPAARPSLMEPLVPPASKPEGPPVRPLWEGWVADRLTVSGGQFAATLPQAGNARVSTGLTISTTSAGDASTLPAYQITLGKPQLAHPKFPNAPIALATAIQLTASAAGLWQKREIDSLTLAGTRLQIGEALFLLMNSLPPTPPPAPVPSTSAVEPPRQTAPPWRLKELVLSDSLIQLDHLGDGRRLEIPVKRQEFHDLPLDATALAAVDRLYKIEVPNITFYSPFSAGQKVAVLDTNYIQFTPSGLIARRLERVDLMSPSLYAGQPLFDFVDAARKRFEELVATPAAPAAGSPMLVDNVRESATMLSALATVTPSQAAAAAEWNIPFYTESGKVFVAPKGYPWPSLPVIPFRNARDAKGQPVPFLLQGETFHGELAIEPGWYDFPDYKVRLRLSDRGRIVFNTPQKDRDNNLTEVFEKNTLIFRQLRIDEAWLSITYDARGIYARFGGRTCGGTLAGGLNLYMDELYTWDAWASLIGIRMQDLTDKLTPESFRMSGRIDEMTVKAYGDTTTLYQASLDLKVSEPGQLHLLALDSMKEKIDALGGISADLGKISMATLRDFAYTGCSGSLKLFGTEGQGSLVLTGPAGSRTFNLRIHDYRNKRPKTAAPF